MSEDTRADLRRAALSGPRADQLARGDRARGMRGPGADRDRRYRAQPRSRRAERGRYRGDAHRARRVFAVGRHPWHGGGGAACRRSGDPRARAAARAAAGRGGCLYKDAGDERADAFTLVRALDRLAQDGVQVINLSLAGPPNTVLEDTIAQITGPRGITVVAASGNAGPRAGPAYPSAYDSVIAVTAVDRNGTAYRRAGTRAACRSGRPGRRGLDRGLDRGRALEDRHLVSPRPMSPPPSRCGCSTTRR